MRRWARDPGVWICSLTGELFNEISHVGSETVGKGRSRAWECRPNFHHELELRRTSWRGCNHFVFLRYAASLAICIYRHYLLEDVEAILFDRLMDRRSPVNKNILHKCSIPCTIPDTQQCS